MAKKSKLNNGATNDGGDSGLESGFQWAQTEITFSFAEESKKVVGYSIDEMVAIANILAETDALTSLDFKIVATDDQLAMDVTSANLIQAGFTDLVQAGTITGPTFEDYLNFIFDDDGDLDTPAGVADSNDPRSADIRFTQKDLNSYYGAGSYPGNGAGGDVVFDSVTLDSPDHGGDDVDPFELELFYHEIGHALGLRHSFEKLFDANGDLNEGYDLPGKYDEFLPDGVAVTDNTLFSVMSYTNAMTNGDEPIYVSGWGAYDLWALDNMYSLV